MTLLALNEKEKEKEKERDGEGETFCFLFQIPCQHGSTFWRVNFILP